MSITNITPREQELQAEIARLEDAVKKGDLARTQAGGMEMDIAELRKVLDAAKLWWEYRRLAGWTETKYLATPGWECVGHGRQQKPCECCGQSSYI